MGGFTIRGRRGGEDVVVHWEDGRLSGDEGVVAEAREVLGRSESVRLSPQDPELQPREDDPVAAMAAVQEALDDVATIEGDYPLREADDSAS